MAGRAMTETMLALVPEYGVAFLALVTFLSCLALPVPASLVMLTGGAFVAGGDIDLVPAWAGALIGAILGDQLGFAIGRWGDNILVRIEQSSPRRAALIGRSRRLTAKYGAPGVFLSRWLFSPLGPYVNYLSGASRLPWRVFTPWVILGEVVWVSAYIGLGAAFSANIREVGEVLGNATGAAAAVVVAVVIALLVLRRGHERAAGSRSGERGR